MNRFTNHPLDRGAFQFTIIYGPINRLWCNLCDKHENLQSLHLETVARLEDQHVCGPRTSAWSARGGRDENGWEV